MTAFDSPRAAEPPPAPPEPLAPAEAPPVAFEPPAPEEKPAPFTFEPPAPEEKPAPVAFEPPAPEEKPAPFTFEPPAPEEPAPVTFERPAEEEPAPVVFEPPAPDVPPAVTESYLGEESPPPRRSAITWVLASLGGVVAVAAVFLWLRGGGQEPEVVRIDAPPPAWGDRAATDRGTSPAPGTAEPAEVEALPGEGATEAPARPLPAGDPHEGAAASPPIETIAVDATETIATETITSNPSEAVAADPSETIAAGSNEAKVDRSAPIGTAAGPLYAVHVASVRTEAGAAQEIRAFERAGFPSLLRTVDLPNKGTWVRIYLGPYGDKEAAREAAGRVKAAGLTDYTQIHRLPESELRGGTGREDR